MDRRPSIEDVVIAHSEGDGANGLIHNIIMYLADGQLAPGAVPSVCQRAQDEGIVGSESANDVLMGTLAIADTYGLR
jgi:hypothetical protein